MKKKVVLAMSLLLAFGNLTNTSAQEPSTESQNDSIYELVENDLFQVELPSGWVINKMENAILSSPDEATYFPDIAINPMDQVDADEEIQAVQQRITDGMGERITKEPEPVEYTVENTDRELKGFCYEYKNADNDDINTAYYLLENVNDLSIAYMTDYLKETAAEDGHEDETTFFEYLHAIDTLTLK